MKLRNVIYLLFIIAFSLGCQSEANKKSLIDPNESALPHGKALPTQALSKADIKELKQAKGKEAIPVTINQLEGIIQNADKQLNCFLFWTTDCDLCQNVLQYLVKTKLEYSNHQIQITLITDETDTEALNLFIRREHIVPKVFQLKVSDSNWKSKINNQWKKFPAIIFANKSEKLHMFHEFTSLNQFEAIFGTVLPSIN